MKILSENPLPNPDNLKYLNIFILSDNMPSIYTYYGIGDRWWPSNSSTPYIHMLNMDPLKTHWCVFNQP